LCRSIHTTRGETGVREILGVLALAKRYTPSVTNQACGIALEMGAPTYRVVRRYLERHPAQVALKQIDPLIRELTTYRDIIHSITEGHTP
jgi:hypothetical protein